MADAERRASRPGAEGVKREEFPLWKKVLLTVAGFLLVSGVALQAFALVRGDRPPEGGKVVSDKGTLIEVGGAGFVESPDRPGAPGEGAGEKDSAFQEWSPALMKGGLSFFLGFCIGYAVRTFFRISAVVIGLVALAIFGLSYAGVLNVDWQSIQHGFDKVVAVVKDQATGFQSFITGSLPAAGLAAMGLFTGFKRN
jgi:uncharacterized membrane protein (Fun14 family)